MWVRVSLFGGVFEAERNLRVVESKLGIRSILGLKLAGAQSGLDRGAQFPANAVEIARDAGFVFAAQPADLCQSFPLDIIQIHAPVICRL